MRGNVTLLIILISSVLLIYLGVEGIKIGDFQILSVSELIEKNQKLDDKISEASKLSTIDYLENIKTLEETYENYKIQKQKYEELAGVTNKNNKEIYETKQYDIGYLWRILGNYATKRNVDLGIQVTKNKKEKSSYNINFTVSGKYSNITRFIRDIEDESDLYFRIYNFKIAGTEVKNEEGKKEIKITATFVVKNVNLDPSTIS